jgi:serine/threonine protein kinase
VIRSGSAVTGYRLLARLGAGGMGRVYLGRSQGGRTVAVKVIHPYLAEDRQFRRRFQQEIAAARRVGGIHTASVVDADTGAEPPWLVTEYIAGPSLQEAIDEHGALPEPAVAALGAGLAEGLKAIHDRNVVHRDLKPGNVLLAQDGPRIIDFGIARAMDATSQTTRTSVVGTPGFMSPEQLRGRKVGPASDVFCLAAVLVFAATGRRPFGEGPIEALGYRVVNEDPDLTGVPASLLPLIAAGLAKDSDDRPGLDAFLDHCAALAEDEEGTLPDSVITMIMTQVAETRALTAAVTTTEPTPTKVADREAEAHEARTAAEQPSGQNAPPPPDTPGRTPQAPSRPQVPSAKPPKPTMDRVVIAVMGVLLVVAAIWFVAKERDEPGSPSAGASTRPTSPRTTAPTPGTSGGSERSSPTPDPALVQATHKAFEKISAGDCLDAYKNPYNFREWSDDIPKAIDCDRKDAYMRVTKVVDAFQDCDHSTVDAQTSWSHRNGGDSIYLCVERHFRVGECFLGEKDEGVGRVYLDFHGKMTSWKCGKEPLPEGYDYSLRVTGLTSGDCPTGSHGWKFRGEKLCARIA